MELSDAPRTVAPVLLFSLVTVETGGLDVLRRVRRRASASRLIVLVYAGAISLATALIALGVGLLAG